jgi:hypothetical protein
MVIKSLSPPAEATLKVLLPEVAAGTATRGSELWAEKPVVAMVVRRPG